MSIRDNLTVVVGVDAKTMVQFGASHRTWRRFHPWLFNVPWIVFYDWLDAIRIIAEIKQRQRDGQFPAHATLVRWPLPYPPEKMPQYESQREKMLSGFCFVPPDFVKTDYWCKIDTDAVALRESDWPREEWFAPDDLERTPDIVAPGWHYSKGAGYLDRLEEWGDTVPALATKPRLEIPHKPDQLRVGHPRWCSWLSFYKTAWTRKVAGWLTETCGPGKLPVPSQDSTHWYAGERGGAFVRKVNFKKHGWTNVPKLAKLIETCQAAMQGEAMIDA